MEARPPLPRTVRFAAFELDSRTGELSKHGIKVRLPDKPFEVLLALLERRGDLVTREELHQRLWPSDTFVDFDHGLNTALSRLREVLSDSAEKPRYIETLRQRGYRFVAPVEEVAAEPPTSAGDVAAVSVAAPAEAPQARPVRAWRWRATATAVVVLALAAAGYFTWNRITTPATAEKLRLVVLPFENLSGDPDQDYFADGLTEEMITQLASFSQGQVAVIARTSAMTYKGGRKGVAEIGRELDVDYLLEGSVRNDGGRVRISAQLIAVRGESHLWAQNYDRDLSGIVALQDDVASAVARQIRQTLSPTVQAAAGRRRTTNPEAYDAYLRGRFHWNKRNLDDLRKGLEYFESALQKDPNYALAHAGIADTYNVATNHGYLDPAIAFPRARAAAQKALELDDSLAEAHAALAFSIFHHDYDWSGAEREYRRAIALNPSYTFARQWYGRFLTAMGRFEEARAEAQAARELDPLSLSAVINIGHVAYNARNYDRAVAEMRRTLELEPNQLWAHVYMAMAYSAMGAHTEAIEAAQKTSAVTAGRPSFLLAYCYAAAGRHADARPIFEYWKQRRKEETVDLVYLAGIHAALGEADAAFGLLNQAHQERSQFLPYVNVFPWLDPLRADPRFEALVATMKFPAPRR